MTSPPLIRVDQLGKCYCLGQTHAHSIRELVNGTVARWFSKATDCHETLTRAGDFWALRDVSFQISAGEVVGIIGRNGAGKSTLLKILSKIVAPTEGRVELRGRVASLLEVGTGFHPELTGRENVFLNGTILGMTKADVRRRFDEIVEFAGVGPFIDTPVKRYSSGMTVRLAFAVAAYLESEILIIDEVLAVGDLEFQRRCLGRMQQVSASGRTVLFVSHNMPSVRALTSRSLVLADGQLIFDGSTDKAIERYTRENATVQSGTPSVADLPRPFDGLSGHLRFVGLRVEGDTTFVEGACVIVTLLIQGQLPTLDYRVALQINRHDETPVGNIFSLPIEAPVPGDVQAVTLSLPTESLAPGRYHCAVSIGDTRSHLRHLYDSLADVLNFVIEDGPLATRAWLDAWGPIRFDAMQVLDCKIVESQVNSLESKVVGR